MTVCLAGHNILVLERSQKEALRISTEFKSLGANIFVAQDQVKSLALQQRWDIDIIICDISFLNGLGEVIAPQRAGGQSKSSPLLFVYGQASLVHPKVIEAKGVIKYFAGMISPKEVASTISGYLYDAKRHLEQLAESSITREISFVLQNGIDTFNLEVSDFSDDGLTVSQLGSVSGETGSLTVIIPEGVAQRFAVRVERKSTEGDIIKLKLLWRDRERWMDLLKLVDHRQKQIIDFLKASSGK
jgi:response regulator RpfG family c-di-GMP phosphodiesterase